MESRWPLRSDKQGYTLPAGEWRKDDTAEEPKPPRREPGHRDEAPSADRPSLAADRTRRKDRPAPPGMEKYKWMAQPPLYVLLPELPPYRAAFLRINPFRPDQHKFFQPAMPHF